MALNYSTFKPSTHDLQATLLRADALGRLPPGGGQEEAEALGLLEPLAGDAEALEILGHIHFKVWGRESGADFLQ